MDKYIKKIDEQMKQFENKLDFVEEDLLARIDSILSSFDVVGGFIQEDNLQTVTLSSFSGELLQTLDDAGFDELIVDTVVENTSMFNERIKDLEGIYNLTGLDSTILNNLQRADVDSIIALKDEAILKASRELTNGVIQGLEISELKNILNKTVSNNLINYTKNQMDAAKRIYRQKTEDVIADKAFDGDLSGVIWEYIGASLVENSHPECVYAWEEKEVPRFFTNKQKEDFEAGIYPAKLKGRSAIRYNCRHYFVITRKKSLEG